MLPSTSTTTTTTSIAATGQDPPIQNPHHPTTLFSDDFDFYNDSSACSTPFVSAPSSPGRNAPPPLSAGGFYYSAPASPRHFILSTSKNSLVSEASTGSSSFSFEFDFSPRAVTTNGSVSAGSNMSSADELFLNGQIRPMKLSSHLQRPQVLAPLIDLDESEAGLDDCTVERGRSSSKFRDKSLRRRTRSMSPLRTLLFDWHDDFLLEKSVINKEEQTKKTEEKETPTPPDSGASSRSSSAGRSSKRWVFSKEFLNRSKSEGRNERHKFWGSLSFSPVKEKIKMEKILNQKIPSNSSKNGTTPSPLSSGTSTTPSSEAMGASKRKGGSSNNGKARRRSAHEVHYTARRAEAEEMRKKTFLPYRQGLLGCLGFSSKSYGAMDGFARALNTVSSR